MITRHQYSIVLLCLLISVATLAGSTATSNKEAISLPDLDSWLDPVRETSDNGTAILIVPMIGQMGSDINPKLYEGLYDQIRAANPETILIELDSRGVTGSTGENKLDASSQYDFEALVELVDLFRVKLSDIPQILWIKNSSSANSTLTFAWDKVYMSKEATLSGTMDLYRQRWGYIDKGKDTIGKMREHVTAHIKNFTALSVPYDDSFGGLDKSASPRHSADLGMAFVDPEIVLSGSWSGKYVHWERGSDGDFILDDGWGLPNLSAILAEELAISEGTVNNRHDVLFSEGIHEYYLVGNDVADSIEDHRKNWRKDLARARDMFKNAQQYQNWATGDQQLYYLMKQLDAYKGVLRLMEKWPGLAMRMGWEFRINTKTLKDWIKILEKQIRQLQDNANNGGRGGRGGGGRGPIGGGGGGR